MYERCLNEAERTLAAQGADPIPVKDVWESVSHSALNSGFEIPALADFSALLEGDRRFEIIPASEDEEKNASGLFAEEEEEGGAGEDGVLPGGSGPASPLHAEARAGGGGGRDRQPATCCPVARAQETRNPAKARPAPARSAQAQEETRRSRAPEPHRATSPERFDLPTAFRTRIPQADEWKTRSQEVDASAG